MSDTDQADRWSLGYSRYNQARYKTRGPRILDMREAGATPSQIAAALDVSVARVRSILDQYYSYQFCVLLESLAVAPSEMTGDSVAITIPRLIYERLTAYPEARSARAAFSRDEEDAYRTEDVRTSHVQRCAQLGELSLGLGNTPITDVGLPIRVVNTLTIHAGVCTLMDLMRARAADLDLVRGIGEKALEEIDALLASLVAGRAKRQAAR